MLSLPIALSLLLAAAPASTDRRTDADELAKTERAFSARAGVIGFRDAFIEYFAPDAIAFRPTPRIALGALRRDPPPRTVLEWRPVVVEVGPWRLFDVRGLAPPLAGPPEPDGPGPGGE